MKEALIRCQAKQASGASKFECAGTVDGTICCRHLAGSAAAICIYIYSAACWIACWHCRVVDRNVELQAEDELVGTGICTAICVLHKTL